MKIGETDAISNGRGECYMWEDRSLKRLSKKARKGLQGWPIATIAFYGPNLSQATKVVVGIVPSKERLWKSDQGPEVENSRSIRSIGKPGIAGRAIDFRPHWAEGR